MEFKDYYQVLGIPRDATAEDIIRRMLNNLEQKLTPELLTEIERQDKTVHEVLTLASIVEREVRVPRHQGAEQVHRTALDPVARVVHQIVRRAGLRPVDPSRQHGPVIRKDAPPPRQ